MADLKSDLFEKSEYVEVISRILDQDLGRKAIISQLHNLKTGDGNTLFYVLTQDDGHYLVDIVGRKIQDNALLYWVEDIKYTGKIYEIYYERDSVVITFFRGEKYNNEYVAFLYTYGHYYPATRFLPAEKYPEYIGMLSKLYRKQNFKLPEELMYKGNEANS